MYPSCLFLLGSRTSRRAGADREGLSCRTQGLSTLYLRDKKSLAGKVGRVGRRVWESASSRKFQQIKCLPLGEALGGDPLTSSQMGALELGLDFHFYQQTKESQVSLPLTHRPPAEAEVGTKARPR